MAATGSRCTNGGLIGGCQEVDSSLGGKEAILDAFKGEAAPESAHPIAHSDDDGGGSAPPLPPGYSVEDCSAAAHEECRQFAQPGEPAAPPPGTPAVTLRDIASFKPAEPSDVMEPNGWAVEGLPANFVASGASEIVSGTLLGQPAEVRFTPVGYRWVHSDGATVASSWPGATWTELGVDEFTPTATSHVYAASGEYSVRLEVALAAEYRFAGSAWLPIAGTLTIDGAPQRVLVGEVDTVLTVGDCNAYPTSPGC